MIDITLQSYNKTIAKKNNGVFDCSLVHLHVPYTIMLKNNRKKKTHVELFYFNFYKKLFDKIKHKEI